MWILRSEASWHDLPERYGNRKNIYRLFNRWAKKSVWEQVFESLVKDEEKASLTIARTIVRAHQHPAGAKKGTKLWGTPKEV